MKLHQLDLANFCQHRERSIEFSDGLIAIIGANGSGKSNLLGAVRWLLTGEHPNTGAKELNISQFADSTENSFGRLTFSHAGNRATITRYLRPDSRQTVMEIAGETVRGDRNVNAAVLNLLETSAQVVNEICIVGQGDIFGFLDRTPAKRAETFAKLFRTDDAARVYAILNKRLGQIHLTDRTNEIAQLAEELETAQTRLAEAQAVLGGDTASDLNARVLAANRTIRDRQEKDRLEASQSQALSELTAANQSKTAVEAQMAELQDNLSTLRAAAEGSRPEADAARTALANIQHHTELARQRQQVEDQIENIRQAEERAIPPEEPSGYHQNYGDELTQEAATIQTHLDSDRRLVQQFKDTGLAECPTCHTVVNDNFMVNIDEAAARVPEREEAVARVRATIQAVRSYELARREFDGRLASMRQQRTQLETQLNMFTVTMPPSVDEEVLQQQIADHAQYVEAITEYERLLSQHSRTAGQVDGRIQQLDSQLQSIERQLAALPVTRDEAAAAAEQAPVLAARFQEVSAAEQEVASQQAAVRVLAEQLAGQQAAEEHDSALRTAVDRLVPVRDLLHREAAPRFVAQRNLQRLQLRVNEQLETFGSDFRVTASEGWSFTARFPDGREQPAERLSAGQRVVLALSFRLAVNFSFADVNFLALDEPTAYLDQTHIDGFAPTLDRLRAFASSRGLQCVIITHETALAPLFDSVIEL